MTEPTDAELDKLAEQYSLDYRGLRDFARAVLAKWGTPPAVAGEPVAWQYQSGDGLWHNFIDARHYKNTADSGEWPIRALYTTPAQAGAVPLTDEQSKALTQARSTAMRMAAEGRIPECGDFAAIAQNLDWLCDSFGIKGGQHG